VDAYSANHQQAAAWPSSPSIPTSTRGMLYHPLEPTVPLAPQIVAFRPDIVITEKGVSGEPSSVLPPCSAPPSHPTTLPLAWALHCTRRPGAALPAQGGHHGLPPPAQERQQPYRQVRLRTPSLPSEPPPSTRLTPTTARFCSFTPLLVSASASH
jgi:hypothetical protein